MASDGETAHPLSTPRRVAELLDYQTGSVVSRTLVKKPTGTLTLFTFDEGEGLSEHSTPHDAVVEVLDGTVEIGDRGQVADGVVDEHRIEQPSQAHGAHVTHLVAALGVELSAHLQHLRG